MKHIPSTTDEELDALTKRLARLQAERRGPRSRRPNRLSEEQCAELVAGVVGDGDGLFLRVSTSGSKSWFRRYTLAGERRDVAFGRFPSISLAEARRLNAEASAMLTRGIDPRSERDKTLAAAAAANRKAPTFEWCAWEYIRSREAGWNARFALQWGQSLQKHVFPHIGALPVDRIATDAVLKIIKPMWNSKQVTANRMRSRMELVLGWATAHGYRDGPNPAAWAGHIEHLLQLRSGSKQALAQARRAHLAARRKIRRRAPPATSESTSHSPGAPMPKALDPNFFDPRWQEIAHAAAGPHGVAERPLWGALTETGGDLNAALLRLLGRIPIAFEGFLYLSREHFVSSFAPKLGIPKGKLVNKLRAAKWDVAAVVAELRGGNDGGSPDEAQPELDFEAPIPNVAAEPAETEAESINPLGDYVTPPVPDSERVLEAMRGVFAERDRLTAELKDWRAAHGTDPRLLRRIGEIESWLKALINAVRPDGSGDPRSAAVQRALMLERFDAVLTPLRAIATKVQNIENALGHTSAPGLDGVLFELQHIHKALVGHPAPTLERLDARLEAMVAAIAQLHPPTAAELASALASPVAKGKHLVDVRFDRIEAKRAASDKAIEEMRGTLAGLTETVNLLLAKVTQLGHDPTAWKPPTSTRTNPLNG